MKSKIHELKYQTNKILSKTTKTLFLSTAILLLSAFATSCIPNLPTGGPVSPNIIYILQNKSIPNSGSPANYFDSVGIDANNDSVFDLYMIRNNGSLGSIGLASSPNTEFAGTTDTFPSYYKIYNLNEPVSNSNAWAGFHYGSLYGPNITLGGTSIIPNTNLNGSGFFGFRIKNGSNYNYGWTKISINILDPKLITLVETAYNTVPNQSINAGIK
ncbi:MAG: hypothetical protein U0T69_12565 [Chitinophagales bacterium]